MIKTVIVDSILPIGEALKIAIETKLDLDIVYVTTGVKQALQQLADTDCKLVLVSANLPDGGALQLTKSINLDHPGVSVIIVGVTNIQSIVVRFIEAGAIGYVLSDESFHVLLGKIRAAFEERALVSPEIATALIERVSTLASQLVNLGIDPSDYDRLTLREKEILGLIADGLSNQEIADGLVIEIGTVKNHVHNILGKLNVHSRHDATIVLSLMERERESAA